MIPTMIPRKLLVFALSATALLVSFPAQAQADKVQSALGFLKAQIAPSGLIDSYVEDGNDYSYTYDNALAALAFISSGDFDSARRVLDAINALVPTPEGGYVHRYLAATGEPLGTLYTGPNCYLLQAMNLYFKESGDGRYNATAQRIGNFLLTQQAPDGGLYGGPGFGWKSAEHNCAAMPALHNLGKLQNILLYMEKAALVGNFLRTECWNGTRFYQGENDSTVITDVQALGALALGAAYKNGAYWIRKKTLTMRTYEARKKVTGFDFDPDKDTVWTEGTLQMALAYAAVGDVNAYGNYKAQAEKLARPSGAFWVVSNPGTIGGEILPRWQAVAPTAWYILAANQDNFLEQVP